MSASVTRRTALRRFGAAGAGLALSAESHARLVGMFGSQTTPITIAGQPVEIRVASIGRSTVRISVVPLTNAALGELAGGGALVAAAAGQSVAQRRDVFADVAAGDLRVRFTVHPPTLHVETQKGVAIQRLSLDATAPHIRFALGKGPLLGFGEGGPQFDRKGAIYTNRNGQGGYQLRTHGGRVPIQWLVSSDGWGLYIHRPLGAFDLTGGDGELTPADRALPLDVFVTASSDPKTIMREYARITGFAELPALWAFGYMQSHRTLAGPEEIDWVARTFREKRLPCDALIYLGTEFTPSGWNTRNGEFGWKVETFPDPKRFIDQAHAHNYKVVLHIVIEGRRMNGAVGDPCTPDKAVPSGRTPDDRWPEDRAVPCYWPYHKPLFDLGVDGWWPDQGDGLDEPSRLARIRMSGKARSSIDPTNGRLRFIATGRPACSATARSCGRAMFTRPGRH